jgi:GT2 family glycosyltransferase
MNGVVEAAPQEALATRLTLSIVSHGHGRLLQRLLRDLAGSAELSAVRVVVTLNLTSEEIDMSPYGALDVVVVRNTTPAGFGRNHNVAFGRCRTPWFAILNPDLRVTDSQCFSKMLAAATGVPDCALLGPVVRNGAGDVEDSVRSNLTPTSLIRRLVQRPGTAPQSTTPARRGQPFYWLAGMCLIAEAKAFGELGGFDERYFLYCEDYDLCARAYNAGKAIVHVGNVSVMHDARRDSHRSMYHLRLHLSSLLRVWRSRAFWELCLRQARSHEASGA